MIRRAVFSLALVAALAVPMQTQAQSLGVDFTSISCLGCSSSTWTMGFAFTALTNTSVVGLAAFDDLMNGLNVGHQIGLWTATGTLLASASIAAGSGAPLMSFFRTVSLGSAVALSAGTQYVVGATNYGNSSSLDQFGYNPTGFTVDPRISFDQDRYLQTTQLLMPIHSNFGGNGPAWFGGNIILGPQVSVPEPGSMMLIATGLLGLVGVKGRRRENLVS